MAFKPPSWMGVTGKKDDKPTSANPMSRFGSGPPKTGNSANNPMARFGTPGKPSSPSKGPKSAASPVSAAAQAKAAKAQKSADRYRDVQRAANKAKKSVLARKGPQDLAGRTQRDMDLKRYRELQKGADSWKARARGEGIRFGGDKPAGVNPKNVRGSSSGSTGSSGSSSGGGGSSASSAVARATGAQASPTTNPTRPQAPKAGTVLAKAMKMKDNGRGVAITPSELKAFMSAYEMSHSGTKLTREQAVMMARYIKGRGGKAAETYGLKARTLGPNDSRAPGTGIH